MSGDELFPALVDVLRIRWYAQPNDVIGGWCVMPSDEPPSCGLFEIADCLSQEAAEHIVLLHNALLVEVTGMQQLINSRQERHLGTETGLVTDDERLSRLSRLVGWLLPWRQLPLRVPASYGGDSLAPEGTAVIARGAACHYPWRLHGWRGRDRSRGSGWNVTCQCEHLPVLVV